MRRYRAILSTLVAVSIVFAPMTAAWAGSRKGMDVAMSQPMEDCASMMKGAAGRAVCPCWDEDKACPPQFCIAKCFQFLGLAQQSRPVVRLVTAHYRPTTTAHPPDWSDQPQPPPPRT